MKKIKDILTLKAQISRKEYLLVLLAIVGVSVLFKLATLALNFESSHGLNSFYDINRSMSSFDDGLVSKLLPGLALLTVLYVHIVAMIARFKHAGLNNKYALLGVVILIALSFHLSVVLQIMALVLPAKFFEASLLQRL